MIPRQPLKLGQKVRVYNMPYIGKGANGFGIRERYRYSASGSQTAFTGSDLDSKTLQFDSGSLLDVYLNGVLLDTADYNTNTANTITLTSGATASDEVMIVVYDVFSLSDAMPKTGGTFSGAVTNNSTTTLNDDVTLTGANYNAVWDKSDNRLEFADNAKVSFGADPDLSIYHNGTESYIEESGTGGIKFRASSIRWEKADGSETLGGVDQDGGWFLKANNVNALVIDADGIITKPLQPLFEVTTSTTQNISNSTLTKTTLWDTKVHDQNNDFDISTDQFTAPVAGTYLMTCALTYETMTAGSGYGIIWKKQSSGGSMDFYKNAYHQATEINITHIMIATTIMTLAQSDKIELHVFQGSGATRTLQANNVFTSSNSMSQNWQGFLIG